MKSPGCTREGSHGNTTLGHVAMRDKESRVLTKPGEGLLILAWSSPVSLDLLGQGFIHKISWELGVVTGGLESREGGKWQEGRDPGCVIPLRGLGSLEAHPIYHCHRSPSSELFPGQLPGEQMHKISGAGHMLRCSCAADQGHLPQPSSPLLPVSQSPTPAGISLRTHQPSQPEKQVGQ